MTGALAVGWPTALAVLLSWSQPVLAQAEVERESGAPTGGAASHLAQFQAPRPAPQEVGPPPETGAQQPAVRPRAPEGMPTFQLPSAAERIGRPPRPVTQFLKYQYSYGSESDATYRRDKDLDKRLRDNSLILAPQVNGYIIYRPNDWLEMMLEMILEREIAAREQKVVTLPNGTTQVAERRRTSLPVDQLWVRFRALGPFDVTLGRRNFEDDRHWLYDTSLDSAFVRFRHGALSAELSYGRQDAIDLDLLKPVKLPRIDNYMLYVDYRGIEDIRLAGYTIYQADRTGKEGKPVHTGVRAYGMPSDRFNFWAELASVRGRDEAQRKLRAHAFDVGATYRFPDLPLYPNVTLGYASGTGDGDPNDNRNTEFRQTGLQSNELRMGGVSKFKYYGEVLDPELSNLRIFTLGFGFRPATSVHVDLVYHKYRLNRFAEEIRNWALTAEMNQDSTRPPSKDVGQAFDIVLGFRNLFGVRRLGLDLRMGWFFPGKALRNDITTDPDNPAFRRADKGISVLAKFWW